MDDANVVHVHVMLTRLAQQPKPSCPPGVRAAGGWPGLRKHNNNQ